MAFADEQVLRVHHATGPEAGAAPAVVKAQAITFTSDEELKEDLTWRVVTSPVRVAPNGTSKVQFDCYFGPKSKRVFEDVPEYARNNYFQALQMDFYCCAPSAIVRLMMWLLQILYWPTHNYGVAIILLVVLVRLLLHPITKMGQVNMMKMQKRMGRLQPKLDELKRKYGNDKARYNQEMMAIYQEEGINPASQVFTCLPLMLQMPIWAGLWAALNSTIEMRHRTLDGFWIKDLAAPDMLIAFGHAVDIPWFPR